ncbi:MAG: S8 family serine peptidase [Spirulina sp. SIO3F2]|nr:S8 family serine peptidase [Spirulina sp. SIO3F2]
MKKTLHWVLGSLVTLGLTLPAQALNDSTTERGIDVRQLHAPPYNLTGKKVAIGQVEIGRPSKFGLDKIPPKRRIVNVAGVFYRDQAARSEDADRHADLVAAVMVSQDKYLRGVAPDANLYASAVGSAGQPQECLAAQHVAQQQNGEVRAINFSFGEPLRRDDRSNPTLDGNALLTRCIDWSSRVHNTLYVIAGNQGSGGIQIPTDHYNGITVAATRRFGEEFAKLSFSNLSALPEGIGQTLIRQEINQGARRAISLVAPGGGINLYTAEGQIRPISGTSFAAPHVTATVAVLQELSDRHIQAGQARWSETARQPEVMKAVLLNAADKVRDPGDGSYLGMTRTVLGKNHANWLTGDAARNNTIPLDIQLGTGHLNAARAYEQFQAGQWQAGESVPAIAWAYDTAAIGTSQDYELASPLSAGTYASVSLAWQRQVMLNDRNGNGQYDADEDFRDRGLNDLNLYLMPADATDIRQAVCASNSAVDSVEHIFCAIPQTGRYKIRVVYDQQVNNPEQAYGLAWWTAAAK